jgi:hypothetical protein
MESSREDRAAAVRMHVQTGKSIQTCLFCLKYCKGNYQRATEMACPTESTEDGR